MIAYLKGIIVEVTESRLILDVNDIGYLIYISGRDASNMPGRGEEVKIYTYLNVKEDAMQLFGFLSEDDLEMYQLLLNVNGIGPKAALGVLSVLTPDDLRFAVLADDAKAIAKAPGIGNKTAQKLILELKDKMAKESAGGLDFSGGGAPPAVSAAYPTKAAEAAQALSTLGYSSQEISVALKGVDVESLPLEEIIRQSLKKMVK